ncbi:segregation and condensation protein B [Fusobacterium naviforme]|uniref:Segregation and condensation protein B n=1 Tax=Moryella indoligenes TaxID=371674 RepID=A0AAE4ALU4_9FIRM|nr:SMC-Scp complex subunit ScpB [Moryella indoligenes]KAB0576529.1 SMC-Scp complex subunit ScpB [Fusobacterium naviforme]MDQ0152937.1 segregation and condensation protein B [Moryella indoligenes]PSL09558.1 segregation and condensation protein B [Fusobacterium naviforme]STO27450.1 Segregation and condensation protein B [Fusobacterium naviforme]
MTTEEARKQEAIVEAVLFTMGKSVESSELAAALQCSQEEAEEAVQRLRRRCEEEERGVQILKLEGSWQMATRREYYDALIRVAKAPKKQVLSQVVLETLSIIAYRQPVTKTEISKIRGVSSDHAVNRLVEYGLVYEAGRLDAPGRPALFATTEEFLRRFGVDSKTDLPEVTPDQEAEIAEEVQKELKFRFDAEEDAGSGATEDKD